MPHTVAAGQAGVSAPHDLHRTEHSRRTSQADVGGHEAGTTKAELIRTALRAAAGSSPRVRPKAVGVFAGLADLSERVDEHLASSGFGGS
jgi:hypothetical protein